jgi:arginyl-tRNA synthetase
LGHRVLAWNYLGDYGTQFGKLSVAYAHWGQQKKLTLCTIDDLLKLYVQFHEEVEKNPILDDEAREAFKKLEQGDSALLTFQQEVIRITKESLKILYERLHVHFDIEIGESFFSHRLASILEEGIQKKVFTEGENGAKIVDFGEQLPTAIAVKSDGSSVYLTRDLALMKYRMETYQPSKILILSDSAQKLHFQQVKATCEKLGWDVSHFTNINFGRMHFSDLSMSTRKGNIVRLETVLDEAVLRARALLEERNDNVITNDVMKLAHTIGIGAVAFSFLHQNRVHDMTFDWTKALSFDGDSAPYLQYTFARIQSLLKKGSEKMVDIVPSFFTENERILTLTLSKFPDILRDSALHYGPHVLAQYALELAQSFNSLYAHEHILTAPLEQCAQRLALTKYTGDIIKCICTLLTFEVPDTM